MILSFFECFDCGLNTDSLCVRKHMYVGLVSFDLSGFQLTPVCGNVMVIGISTA